MGDIPHPFMIKIVIKLVTEGSYLNNNKKTICDKPVSNAESQSAYSHHLYVLEILIHIRIKEPNHVICRMERTKQNKPDLGKQTNFTYVFSHIWKLKPWKLKMRPESRRGTISKQEEDWEKVGEMGRHGRVEAMVNMTDAWYIHIWKLHNEIC